MNYLKYILIASILLIGTNAFAQTTTIWLVRHAEKAAPGGAQMMATTDPDLSPEGKARAEALAAGLKDKHITAVFTTPYKRTAQTALPTLKHFKLDSLQHYDAGKLKAFAKKAITFYPGQNVLIVGHSNTVIPTLEAFGGLAPFATLSDDDYDMLFKITVSTGSLVSVGVRYYGAKHHTTDIKE